MKLTPIASWVEQKTAGEPLPAWQVAKINATLALVRSRSPFYRRHLAGMPETIASLDELHQFPFTTSQDIRRNPLQFVCLPQGDIQRVVTLQTSGTSGEPKRIYFSAGDQERTIEFFGVGMSTLTEPGERVLVLLPGETPGSVGDLLRLGLGRLGRIPLPYGPVRDPLHALETMHAQQADCLVGSPTQVLGLARRWKPGRKAPRTLLLSTDYVPAALVRELENTWGCEVFNHYGTTEMGLGAAVECEAHRGYHLREADLYFEIVHPDSGEPLAEGEYGEVVFTTLTREGMPLIRYRMGDRSRFIPAECPCGANLRLLEKVRGRFSDFVPVGDEVLRLPDFDEALFSVPGLLNFSVMLLGGGAETTLMVEAQMLTNRGGTQAVEEALQTISSIRQLKTTVRCIYNPQEAGSLAKRTIVDRREI